MGLEYTSLCMRACIPRNLNSDSSNGTNSKGHNSINLSSKYQKFMLKLKPKMSTFQWNKPYAKILCGEKVMVKIISKGHFSASFSKWFKDFWVVITSKLSK